MLDPAFFEPIDIAEDARDDRARRVGRRPSGFEAAMDAVRRAASRAGLPRRRAGDERRRPRAEDAGRAFADLADLCIAGAGARRAGRGRAAWAGAFAGEVAVVALGKCGSREMSAGSDLDLMTLYRADDPAGDLER